MTRRELFNSLFAAASGVYDEREARSAAYLIADSLYGISRLATALEPDAEVDVPELERVLRELADGRPAQYIAGWTEFCGYDFAVSEGVLIPRPETEELVRWIAGECAPGEAILDIGTGSGAIAVSLAAMVEDARVCAIDISDKALETARENAGRNAVNVAFHKGDALLPPVEWEGEWMSASLDIIVSNPPYIPAADLASMHRNVTDFEPHAALFVPDNDPLVFYRAIAESGRYLLADGGRLYFEVYEHLAGEVAELLEAQGYDGVEVRRDINGRERMVKAVKK